MLGVLVARAAGQPFDALLLERIFEPLGMADTGFFVPVTDLPRCATGHRRDQTTGEMVVYDPAVGRSWNSAPRFPSGGGGLVSTGTDLPAFARALPDGSSGPVRLLSRPTIEAMTSDQLTPAQKTFSALVPGFFERNGWGFGVSIVTGPDGRARNVGTYGWDG